MSYTPKSYDSDQILEDATFSPQDWKDFNYATMNSDGPIHLGADTVFFDTTSGAIAATLADGAEGQVMYLKVSAFGSTNEVVVTPDNFLDGSTITFDAVNLSCILKFANGNWNMVGDTGATIA